MGLESDLKTRFSPWELAVPVERWDDWVELDPVAWPKRVSLKRSGPRGSGKFEEVSWEAALDDIGGRIRKALEEDRRDEVMYHVGRPGEDHFVLRMLQAWGVDGHNSHTNVCSASARLG